MITQALVIVSSDTVLRWQRRRFCEYWARLSRRPTGGRPPLHTEIADLVRKMAAANPVWGAPRIHGEFLKIGIDVAERTVSCLDKDAPDVRPITLPMAGKIVQLPEVGGLHHRHLRQAA